MVLILLTAACLKPSPPLQTGAGRPLRVVNLLDAADDGPTRDTPDRFDSAVLTEASRRSLVPALVQEPRPLEPLTATRETAPRVRLLAPDPAAGAVLLVETRPVYYSELNGQYRWTVGVVVTLAGAETPYTRSFDVPVFLQYHHEREDEAVNAASPVVARQVGEVLDAWLGGGG
jgi:hypothetical protein